MLHCFQNIILRYGLKHNLHFAMPINKHDYFYPRIFKRDYIQQQLERKWYSYNSLSLIIGIFVISFLLLRNAHSIMIINNEVLRGRTYLLIRRLVLHMPTVYWTLFLIPSIPTAPYNLMAFHIRFNYEEVKAVMPEDTTYVAIIREPFSHFESTFHFFYNIVPSFQVWY